MVKKITGEEREAREQKSVKRLHLRAVSKIEQCVLSALLSFLFAAVCNFQPRTRVSVNARARVVEISLGKGGYKRYGLQTAAGGRIVAVLG